MDVDIKLLELHPKQKYIRDNRNKRNVVRGGRRVGKTSFFADYSVDSFLQGRRVAYGTPVQKQLKSYWGYVKKFLKPLIQSGHVYKNETDKMIRWAHEDSDGAMISAQTAYDADTWRGDYVDVLILDEYAFMHPDVWEVVGFPMLLDTGGEAWFGSTPNRKNHFYYLDVRGIDPEEKNWSSFYMTSYDNPHLDQAALNEMIGDATEDIIKQEIMAEFLENEGAVFRNIDACHHAEHTRPQDHEGHSLVAGVDWGKMKDYTVASIGCTDCQSEVDIIRFNKIDYQYQRRRLLDAWEKWGVTWGLAETNSIGSPNLEMLQNEIDIDGFNTTATSKPPLIESLVLTLEREEIQFLNNPIARAEMEAYELTVSKTGRPQYNAPSGVHDDTVIARALMRKAMLDRIPALM